MWEFIETTVDWLGLRNLDIIIKESTFIKNYTYGLTEYGYNKNTKTYCWQITLDLTHVTRYVIVHEFGHIYFSELSKKYEVIEFNPKSKNDNDPLFWICNNLEDAFVNYNLVKKDIGLIQHRFKNKIAKIEWSKVRKIIFEMHIGQYIEHYLHYKYLITQNEKIQQQFTYKININNLKKAIKMFNKEFDFDLLNSKLNQFSKIKDTHKYLNIQKYKKNVLRVLGYDIGRINKYLGFNK